MRTIAARTESAGWRAVTKSRRAWRAIRMRMEEAMCRIGAIKSKVPVEPAKALYLMLPQQEGHDNSGYAMVMQDLYGVFEGHKDKPLLSLACTPRGVRMVEMKAYVPALTLEPEGESVSFAVRLPAAQELNLNPSLLTAALEARFGLSAASASILRTEFLTADKQKFQ